MVTLNFPSSPSVGDTYTFGGKTWIWTSDGAWKLQSSGAINGFPIGNSDPNTGAFTTLTSSGNTTLGNIAGSLLPAANVTYDLGSSTQKWNNLYLGNLNVTTLSTTGNITAGNVIAIGTVKAANIDSSSADLAEKYLADADYPVGTVLVFGGDKEVTQSQSSHDTAIVGTVSESPGYTMNADLSGPNVVTVALLGRVPCRVTGSINKGDLLVSSETPGVATSLDQERYRPGCVIGKALENYSSNSNGIIEIVVGRL